MAKSIFILFSILFSFIFQIKTQSHAVMPELKIPLNGSTRGHMAQY